VTRRLGIPLRLAAFVLALGVAFAAAYAVGVAVEPVRAEDRHQPRGPVPAIAEPRIP
jgi:hypothetical protein